MKSGLRIALFHNLPSGGAKRAVCEFTRGLVDRGHDIYEIRLSTADANFLNMSDLVTGEKVFSFTAPTYKRFPVPGISPFVNAARTINMIYRLKSLYRRIASYIDNENFDVVWVNDCKISYKPLLMRYLKTPCIFYSHHGGTYLGFYETLEKIVEREYYTPHEKIKNILFWLPACLPKQVMRHEELISASSVQYVVTNSCFAAESYYQFFGTPARVAYYGVNHQTFKPSSLTRDNYFLSVGALIFRKGYRFLISALSMLPPAYRLPLKIIANFIEPKEAEKVKLLAEEGNVKVEILQIFDDAELAKLYQQATIFLYAPILEAFGLAPLESLACGTPIVVVNEGGPRESVIDGVTGFQVERDPVVFSKAIIRLLQNEKLREEMGKNGIEITRTQWSWPKASANLEKHLYNAIQLAS